tara:strand:- start:347 stop:712 length:366 start_codon:yes stop_codon:yes gene_type:complete
VITYLYWAAVIGVALFVFWGVGRYLRIKAGLIGAAIILIIGWGMYYFHYEQVFVKNFGGVMSIAVPEGQLHMQATWKDDNLWIENYDPKTNTCIFSEYSKGNLLEGRVKIKNCNPLMPKTE